MTSRYRRFAAAALAVALTAPGVLLADAAVAEMVAADGLAIGKVTFEQVPAGVLIYVEIDRLPPGLHGIHLHSVGSCTPDFTYAKGHINPGKAMHGLRHPDGPDNGDLPNLYVAGDGTARAEFYTTRVAVQDGVPALLDADGSAVIIHENPDDHLTQPIGGAGGRIACGVIEPVPSVKAYENCADMRAAGWTRGVTRDGGTYRGSWDAAERETYRLNYPSKDRDDDGHACE